MKPHQPPIVSIGLPVFNGEEFLQDALDSLLAQSFANFELIISDNASTDRTAEICHAYSAKDSRIRYIRQPRNLGAAANFKFVLDEATCEYFMWAACDDVWDKEFLECAITELTGTTAGFAFPLFTLKSIRFPLARRSRREIYMGFEDNDRSMRILAFANLHHNSIKDMLLYSLFRTDVLRAAFRAGDSIPVGPILCMLILGEAKGVILNKHVMLKRYRKLWPGFKKKLFLKIKKRRLFEQVRDERTALAKTLFPELAEALESIRRAHKPCSYHSGYKILKKLPILHADKATSDNQ